MSVIGVDVGGANLKVVALSDSGVSYKTVHFPLWIKENCIELCKKLTDTSAELASDSPRIG